jgi:CDP-diacylglycerol--glycerol-3-phosphate 3-phosphatidyltransferase
MDGIDGAVAVLSSKSSRWGHVADSLVDRLVEVALLIALHRSGAPAQVALLAGVMTACQEYARARAAGVGLTDITVVTVSERPTRIIAAAVAFTGAAFVPQHSTTIISIGTAVWAVLGVVGLIQMIVAVRKVLITLQ